MTKYIVSFRNGHKMKLDVTDGEGFIREMCQGPRDVPGATHQYFVVGGVMICQTDVTACHPANMDVTGEV